MEDLPFWLKVLSALATPAIALLGFAIAWGQWATARSKLILDLFERRLKVYNDLKALFQGDLEEDDPTNSGDYIGVVEQAQFLFGGDVLDLIDKYNENLVKMGAAATLLKKPKLSSEQRDKASDMWHQAFLTLMTDFHPELQKRMVPYLLMDQKRPWTISRIPRWFGWRWRQLKKAIVSIG